MSVATWLLNIMTMLPTAYKAALDGNAKVAQRVADNFAPHEQSTPNMTVRLDAGFLFNGSTTLTEVAAQSTGAIVAPVSNPRIDRIVIDTVTGAVSVITGTPAGSPTAPAITAGKLPVAQVLVQTTSTIITNTMITDERAVWTGALPFLPLAGGTLTGALHMSGAAIDEDQGANIASSATVNLDTATGNSPHITGTTGVTAITLAQGSRRKTIFDGALTITHNATTLILLTGANITTAAGDIAEWVGEAAGVRMIGYERKSGKALVGLNSGDNISLLTNNSGYITSLLVAPLAVGSYLFGFSTTNAAFAAGSTTTVQYANAPSGTGMTTAPGTWQALGAISMGIPGPCCAQPTTGLWQRIA